jgi:NAD-dependent dihydropyrimidine dehydrogenase PreA subunit
MHEELEGMNDMEKLENTNKRDRGRLRVDGEECKGCGLCVEACPPKVIALSEHMNHYGYRTAAYAGTGCTGCGICFMVCPEPGAMTVLRLVNRPVAAAVLNAGSVEAARA